MCYMSYDGEHYEFYCAEPLVISIGYSSKTTCENVTSLRKWHKNDCLSRLVCVVDNPNHDGHYGDHPMRSKEETEKRYKSWFTHLLQKTRNMETRPKFPCKFFRY